MILYVASKSEFLSDIQLNQIEVKISDAFARKLCRSVGQSEVNSWRNSLVYMGNAVRDPDIHNDVSIAIEYRPLHSSRRIDVIVAGHDEQERKSLVIVELKQWTEGRLSEKDGIVETAVGGGVREVLHPSYQAWSYATLLQDYSTVVQDEGIRIASCAYLHNSLHREVFQHEFYSEYLTKAPLFLRDEASKVTSYIKERVTRPDEEGIIHRIDQGKVRPSKSLADRMTSMLQGNREFIMVDEQKIAYETALFLAAQASKKNKQVLIIEGGPGTGKSVIAVNLLVEMIRRGMTSQYVTKNAAPRAVYEYLLTKSFKKSTVSSLFVGSGAFTETEANSVDALIVDEAHRLNAKSGLFANLGDNQVHELIKSSLFSVFFVDEDQRVTTKDIGSKEEIRRWAIREKAQVAEIKLASQFRCNGSEAYLAWLDHALQVRETANHFLHPSEYDFRIMDDPGELRREIERLNGVDNRNKSRLVAGYCWSWKSKKDKSAIDIDLGPTFRMQWNLATDGGRWIVSDGSVEHVGCIHTCQGLELDYVGVIIGADLIVRNGKVITDATKRDRGDQSIKGYKVLLKKDPERARSEAEVIIKNTYRTLMTRGFRGCLLYSTDPETREYFRGLLRAAS
jgi:DUF2075 family protein